jgi:hypothetical protein
MSDTLLTIEDKHQNLYLMRFLLEKNGFEAEIIQYLSKSLTDQDTEQ